jgi:hypothetical protein
MEGLFEVLGYELVDERLNGGPGFDGTVNLPGFRGSTAREDRNDQKETILEGYLAYTTPVHIRDGNINPGSGGVVDDQRFFPGKFSRPGWSG